jgi:hypothetical protein
MSTGGPASINILAAISTNQNIRDQLGLVSHIDIAENSDEKADSSQSSSGTPMNLELLNIPSWICVARKALSCPTNFLGAENVAGRRVEAAV